MDQLTRQQLFDLVWSTPVSKLAARFGISGVPLARTCGRFDIPRPGRGYWHQLSVGLKPKRPKLPPSTSATTIEFEGPSRAPTGETPALPVLTMRDHLRDLLPVVRWVEESAASAQADGHCAAHRHHGEPSDAELRLAPEGVGAVEDAEA